MATKKPAAANKPDNAESYFSKNQLLAADRFRDRRDLLNALLSSDECYTVRTVEQKIENYLKGQVK